ncbi:SDR family NAD(P)-dependent oxidoreductase [Pedobacter psychroterrae]|uniref:SDR family oxidoreductase n=1 Tax=Pedobacter psychroterrae TaxID=2530453 RepID=A0A4R0NK52_9SPHI|nr:SDR family oxidoreductase [Pedobacter psychroterrae]TCD00218.1 SDR family oxidoreductase [Pedobacter psychroterrae]
MNFKDFEGMVAIVTGAGKGIGYEIASKLVRNGASVIINDNDPELIKSASDSINAIGPGVTYPIAGDAGDIDLVQQLVDEAVQRFGKLNVVVANAGITLFGDFLKYEPQAFQDVMRVNLQGSFFLAQRASLQMIKQQSGGSILFMSSVTGQQAHKDLAAYAMTKAGLQMLAKNLVIELSEYKITVNTVAPGATLTERTLEDEDYKSTWARITPMGRAGTVDDVANAVLFLVSPQASQITGQTLVVDGGWSAVSISPF